MPVPVYYNFNPIKVNLGNAGCTQQIKITPTASPQTNVKIHDVNYFADALYLKYQTTSEYYLIIKCLSDANDQNSNALFFAIQLTPAQRGAEKSFIDKLLSSGNNKQHTIDLEPFLQDGNGKISNEENRAITVIAPFKIPFSESITNSNIFGSSIAGLKLDADLPAALTKQDLDWVMSCDLLDENGTPYPNPTMNDASQQKDTAYTITFLMMTLLIAGSANMMAPIVYKSGGLQAIAELFRGASNIPNHYTINVYWGILLITAAVFCVIQWAISNETLYQFLAISLVLAYFAATRAIVGMDNTIGNDAGNGFRNSDNMFQYFSDISSKEAILATGTLPSVLRIVAAVLLYFGMISGIILMIVGVSLTDKLVKRPIFSVGIMTFLTLPAISMFIIGGWFKQ
jgi:hypothetical protein